MGISEKKRCEIPTIRWIPQRKGLIPSTRGAPLTLTFLFLSSAPHGAASGERATRILESRADRIALPLHARRGSFEGEMPHDISFSARTAVGGGLSRPASIGIHLQTALLRVTRNSEILVQPFRAAREERCEASWLPLTIYRSGCCCREPWQLSAAWCFLSQSEFARCVLG